MNLLNLALHLLTNGILDHDSIGVDCENNVGCPNLGVEELNVLV